MIQELPQHRRVLKKAEICITQFRMHGVEKRQTSFIAHISIPSTQTQLLSLAPFGRTPKLFIRFAFQTKTSRALQYHLFCQTKKKASELQLQIVRSDLKRKDL